MRGSRGGESTPAWCCSRYNVVGPKGLLWLLCQAALALTNKKAFLSIHMCIPRHDRTLSWIGLLSTRMLISVVGCLPPRTLNLGPVVQLGVL